MPININDFKKNVSEDILVTILKDDGTQWVGTVVAIRDESVKLRLLGSASSTPVIIHFANAKSFKPGKHNLTEQNLSKNEPARIIRTGHVPNRDNLTDKKQPSPVTTDAAAPTQPTVATSPVQPQTNFANPQLDTFYKDFSSRMKCPLSSEIEPNFSLKLDDSIIYSQKQEFFQILNTAKQIYSNAQNFKDINRLGKAVIHLSKATERFPKQAIFHALKGAFLFALNKNEEALDSLKTAAALSDAADDWLNLARAATDAPVQALAFSAYFESDNPVMEEAYWGNFVKASCDSGSLPSLCRTINKIAAASETIKTLDLMNDTLIFLFIQLGMTDEAISALSKDKNNVNLQSTVLSRCQEIQFFLDKNFKEESLISAKHNIKNKISSITANKSSLNLPPRINSPHCLTNKCLKIKDNFEYSM